VADDTRQFSVQNYHLVGQRRNVSSTVSMPIGSPDPMGLWRLPISLANLWQRVVKVHFPPPLDVTLRTQRSQYSAEQQSISRASSS
jgi:hypothetical protein